MNDPTNHQSRSGKPLTDDEIERLADEAEAGYDTETLRTRRGRRGRPPLGTEAATVESVRIDPDMKRRLAERAKDEGTTVSEVIREALRHHLEAS
jgi:Ribbon-helix-helix protein, copG family